MGKTRIPLIAGIIGLFALAGNQSSYQPRRLVESMDLTSFGVHHRHGGAPVAHAP